MNLVQESKEYSGHVLVNQNFPEDDSVCLLLFYLDVYWEASLYVTYRIVGIEIAVENVCRYLARMGISK